MEGEISAEIAKALRYYYGEPFGNEEEDQSSVVSTDVPNSISVVSVSPAAFKAGTATSQSMRPYALGSRQTGVYCGFVVICC